MVLPLTPDSVAPPQLTATEPDLYVSPNGAHTGRSVLDGAFTVLDALSHAHHGLGLTDLAHASGLAKTSVYRLAEQLVAVGAVQRLNHRYFIGPMIGRLGHCWQPDPLLRRVCEEPLRRLGALTGATASVYVLHQQQARLVAAAAPPGQSWVPPCEFDTDNTPRTSVGRVLLVTDPCSERPAAIPEQTWARWRAGIHDERFVITESDRAPEGCSCAAAPIWRPDGECAGAAAIIARAPVLSRTTIDMLLHTAQRIGHGLRSQRVRSAS